MLSERERRASGREGKAIEGIEAGPPGGRETPKSWRSGPEYVTKAGDLLRSIRDQCRELERFRTHPGYPRDGAGLRLWGSIAAFERLTSGGFEGSLDANPDEVQALEWARSILDRLASEPDRHGARGVEELLVLTEGAILEAFDAIVAKLTRSSPIAAYLAEIEAAREAWDEACRRARAIRQADPKADPPSGADHRDYEKRREEIEARHFPGVDPRTGAGLTTPSRLWRWIANRLYIWDDLGLGRFTGSVGSPHPCWDDLVKAYGDFHRLGLPGAPGPPYVRNLSERDAVIAMHTLANTIRQMEPGHFEAARRSQEVPGSSNGSQSAVSVRQSGRRSNEGKDQVVSAGIVAPPIPDPIGRDPEEPTEADLVTMLRKIGRPTQARLVEFLVGRREALSVEIADEVHDDSEISSKGIGKNVSRTNDSLVEFGSRIRYRFASSRVFKEKSPE